jgi:hypothetical protein
MRPRPNFPQEPDPTRPVIFTVGVYRAPASVTIGPESDRSLGAPRVVMTKPCFSSALENLPYQLRRGDIIERTCNGAHYECEAPEKDDLGVRCHVPVHQMRARSRRGRAVMAMTICDASNRSCGS